MVDWNSSSVRPGGRRRRMSLSLGVGALGFPRELDGLLAARLIAEAGTASRPPVLLDAGVSVVRPCCWVDIVTVLICVGLFEQR